MRVRAAKTKAVNAGHNRFIAIQRYRFHRNGKSQFVKRYLGVGFFEVEVTRHQTVLQHQTRFDQARCSRACLKMTNVCFDRPQQEFLPGGTAPPQYVTKRPGLNGVARLRTRAVRFDITYTVRIHAGLGINRLQ